MTTPVKRIKFNIPNTLKTGSGEISEAGSIKRIDPHIPRAHTSEISDEDFLFHILYTRGKLKRGIIIPAAIPATFTMSVKYSDIKIPLLKVYY